MTEGPSGRVRDLSPLRQALLVHQMRGRKAAGGAVAHSSGGIPRRSSLGSAPLSFAQERLWLLDRLEPGTTVYNMPIQVRLRGLLDVAALALGVAEIVRRHETLRTTFSERDAQVGQEIAPPGAFRLPAADLEGLAPMARRAEGSRLLVSNSRPFDLARGPLMRANLVRLSAEENLLLIDMHHIVSDGWSFGILIRELGELYGAFREGRASPLPELPIQYADFAAWQRGRLRGAVLEEQVSYWRERLAGAPPALELPLDRVRPVVQGHRGRAIRSDLAPAVAARLRELALGEGASPFMTLLAAFQLLLSRLSGQDDVVVGSPSAGRGRAEVEGLIGLFLNTLVLRTDLSGDPSFRELLLRVKESVLGAYRYQEIPFERLLEELQPERQLSRTPLFQVLFNFVSISNLQMSLPGLLVEPIESAEAGSKFDFTIYVSELTNSFRFELVYAIGLFEDGRMREMVRQFEHLLEQVVANPEAKVGTLSLVTPAVAAALLPDPTQRLSAEWRGSIQEALSRGADHHPDRSMVEEWSGVTWTYGELQSRANQLARFLGARGVGKGDTVAVWAHRSASLAQALLGTLKAGAAFLVLDPLYPEARLLDYLRIGRPAAWVAVPGAPAPPPEVEAFASRCRCRVELTPAALSYLPTTDPAVVVGPDDAACITFTSGSTGMPKGVVGRHGPLTHYQPWVAERFGLGADDCFGMLSALSHDPLQRDVFTPVWLGARMVLPDPDRIGAPGYLARWLRSEEVTVLHLTPAMLELVLDSANDGPEPVRDLPSLRRVFVVGDLLKKVDVERLHALAPSVACINLYGSTETQRSVSYFPVPRGNGLAHLGKEVLPVGWGMEGCQLLVLNRSGRLAGVGEVGEIHVRSRHLAQGYLGDEALSAERFLANPLVVLPEEGDRVYRTGDLGRYLPDGGVEIYGRADFQVKIRGFRIELGEVEAVLARHPEVRECLVMVREDCPGERRLVGYLVATGAAPLPHDLRAFLGSRLPDYMVPSAFVVLPALPLTRTGKVDRWALPVPDAELSAPMASVQRNPVVELLAGIWADLLGVDGVASGESFFELGGHSLLATRMISRVRAVLGVELPMRAVFEEPTLAGFAFLTEQARQRESDAGGAAPPSSPPLVRVPRSAPLPASFAQQRLWFLDRLDTGSFAYNLSGALRLEGALDEPALAGALDGIVRRHESLRTHFVAENGELWQVISEPLPFELPVADLSGLDAAARAGEELRLALAEARRPYDLSAGPLARFALLRSGRLEHVLLVGMHHIVSDGWSMSIFVRELGARYRAGVAKTIASLPDLPVQYADYATWQRLWLNEEAVAERLGWWTRQLAGAPPVVTLPLDRPRPSVQGSCGHRVSLEVAPELALSVERMGRRLGVTPFMALLAAFATLLSRYGGQDDVVVGTPIANRGRTELENLIGFFINMLALRVDLSGDPSFGELARRVREMSLGAFAHQDVLFERLVDELRPERSLSHSPVFQVVLALQNLPAADLDLAGLTLTPLEIEAGRTQFDLSLFLYPMPDGGLLARLDVATALFEVATANRLLGHFRNLLEGIAAEKGASVRVSELPWLDPAEREQLLTAWNRTAAEIPEEPVHRLFFQWAERTPEALAVAWSGGSLTYAELAGRARGLADRLRANGVGPESVVALCLDPSPELLVAVLGVLAAGGAYLPIDPAWPKERQRWILEDSGAVLLSGMGEGAISREAGEVQGTCPADRLAYVIYTSGSTGRPKGTELCHGGLSSLIAWHRRAYDLMPADRTTLLAGPGFDASVWEIWAALTAGATLHIPPREVVLAPAALLRWLAEEGITGSFVPTPLAEAVLSEPMPAGLCLRVLLTGGDRLRERPAPDLPFALVNHYGPTECTVVATAGRVEPTGDRAPDIGFPIANSRVYILDRGLQLVPVGVAGELCLAGEGLARGYRFRPELTAESFVPDPFGAGARLYRTGDLARRMPGGEIEFQGRFDHQVKIRGFRIELGEVEAALAALPNVESCVVVVRADPSGGGRLVAYLVATSGDELDSAALRRVLETRLPAYMIPAAFVVLPALPLDPNGKIDRRALPEPSPSVQADRGFIAPRTPLEEEVAQVWCEVLGLERVGVEDNFWDLGGHSLLATRVLARLADTFGVEIQLQALFLAPTLGGFAAAVGGSVLAGLSDHEWTSLMEDEV